eukprot:scaffold75397_cov67-Cyclotella_meneghiniana.AAC.10
MRLIVASLSQCSLYQSSLYRPSRSYDGAVCPSREDVKTADPVLMAEKGDATMQRPCAYAKMGVRISCMLSLPELLHLMLLSERASSIEALVLTSSDDLRIAETVNGETEYMCPFCLDKLNLTCRSCSTGSPGDTASFVSGSVMFKQQEF